MTRFTSTDLRRLVNGSSGDCLSIYFPTYRAGREVRQNAVRLDNLVKQVRGRLDALDKNGSELAATLNGLSDRVTSDESWTHPKEGMAIFAKNGDVHVFTTPYPLAERIVVSDRLYLRPLLRAVEREGRFYILAVSQNAVRLFDADEAEATELHPEGLPADLRSALQIDEYRSTLDYHMSLSVGQGAAPTYSGQGGSDMSVRKADEIQEFFRIIDHALSDYFGVERYPLVFAGVEYLFPIFKETSHYTGLVSEPVTGNPEQKSAAELHAAAWKAVEPIFDEDRRAASERYLDRIATDRTTDDLATLLEVADLGQIDTLLLRPDAERWGRVEADGIVDLSPDDADAEELYDRLATRTLANSGKVYSVGDGILDETRPAGAILRYPLSASGVAVSASRGRRG